MIDIFKNKDFLEQCKVQNYSYDCIVSSVPEGIVYTEYGQQGMANFTLELKLPLKEELKKNMKVVFRNKNYKIDYFEFDSANTSVKLYLVSNSKGI